MSGIFFASTGGSLMNRARPLWPGHRDRHPVARAPLLRERNCFSASAISSAGSASGWREDLGILDVVEGLDDDLVGVVVRPATQGLQRTLPDVDSPYGVGSGHGANLYVDGRKSPTRTPETLTSVPSPSL